MAYSIEYSPDAAKALRRMPKETARLIRAKLAELAVDPYAARNVKKLTDHPGYRLRVGNWRVVYLLEDRRMVVSVVKIATRGQVYQ